MIVTVTPNPSVDRTIAIRGLLRGEVQRATASQEDAGGKGINVARALCLAGAQTVAVLPVGGGYGDMMLSLLGAIDLPVRPVRITESIRANVALVEPDGTTTKINELGPILSPLEVAGLERAVVDSLTADTSWIVGCGSLPRSVGLDFYASLIRIGHEHGVKVAIDSSGPAMTRALAAGPDLVKPNRVELAEVVGRDLPTMGDVVAAAKEYVSAGIETVVVSLGRDGAVAVTSDIVVHAQPQGVTPVSTVGAGDALLAGYLASASADQVPADAIRSAVAFGAAAVALPGSEMPTPSDVARVEVVVNADPDLAHPLTD